MLFAGKLTGSLRLAALAHHIHNASAPNNEVLLDYVEAAIRSGHNETSRTREEEDSDTEDSHTEDGRRNIRLAEIAEAIAALSPVNHEKRFTAMEQRLTALEDLLLRRTSWEHLMRDISPELTQSLHELAQAEKTTVEELLRKRLGL